MFSLFGMFASVAFRMLNQKRSLNLLNLKPALTQLNNEDALEV